MIDADHSGLAEALAPVAGHRSPGGLHLDPNVRDGSFLPDSTPLAAARHVRSASDTTHICAVQRKKPCARS
jgi:hypothetical protein